MLGLNQFVTSSFGAAYYVEDTAARWVITKSLLTSVYIIDILQVNTRCCHVPLLPYCIYTVNKYYVIHKEHI